MSTLSNFESVYWRSKHNRWMRYFTVCCRIALAIGFLPSGYVKIAGERFTALSSNHPLGNYLDALHLTGYYYTFIGIAQMTAAILLLVPRTATLGALIYFPIIVNICILSLAVCFDGSMLTSPLMVIANFYLLVWDYDKLKWIVIPRKRENVNIPLSNRFPIGFFSLVFLTIISVGAMALTAYTLKPHNAMADCLADCPDADNPAACEAFCDCIHTQGNSYDQCLDAYKNTLKN